MREPCHHIEIPLQPCFVMSDIHGKHALLENLLKQTEETEKILFLGDYCDRGKDSLSVLLTVKRLVDEGKAYAVRGNHDQMFLDFLDAPDEQPEFYYNQGGRETIDSFYDLDFSPSIHYTPKRVASYILESYPDLIDFIRNLPYTIEMGDWLFVHAGIRPYSTAWKTNTSLTDMLWIRQEFYFQKNETGKRVMFGHTSSYHLPLHDTPIWMHRDKTSFGIDGGAGGSGCLNGVRMNNGEISEVIKAYQNGSTLMFPFESY